jgi:hypothetical protein
MMFLDWLEVGVLHSVLWGDSFHMIVSKHLRKEIKGFFANQMFVLAVNELVPGLLSVLSQNIVIVGVQGYAVLFNIGIKLVSSKHLSDFNKLVVVVLALEEWFLLENHACEHASKRPNVKRVVVGLQVNEKLWALEVARCNSDIILLPWVIELSKSPINKSQFSVLVVNHNVVWLHITMGDSLGVAEIKSLEHFVNVVSDVKVSEILVESTEINIASVYMLHDKCGGFSHWISNNIDQVDYVHSIVQGLKNLNLSSDLGLLD